MSLWPWLQHGEMPIGADSVLRGTDRPSGHHLPVLEGRHPNQVLRPSAVNQQATKVDAPASR
jgi:hypothetical protein